MISKSFISLFSYIPCWSIQARSGSQAALKPRPRSYKRRLYEAALKPILPEDTVRMTPSERCSFRGDMSKNTLKERQQLFSIEIALAKHVKNLIKDKRLFAVCQVFFIVDERTLRIQSGLMRLDGLIVKKGYNNNVLKEVVKNTWLASLEPLFCCNNAIVYGNGIECLPALIKHTKKLPWLVPLAIAVEDRILTPEDAEYFGSVASVNSLRWETLSLLTKIPSELSRLLTAQLTSLLENTEALEQKKRSAEEHMGKDIVSS